MKGYSIVFLFLFCIIWGCVDNSNVKDDGLRKKRSLENIHIEQDSIVDIYIDRINNLEEITNLSNRIPDHYNLKYLLLEDSINDLGEHYFWIQAGYDDGYRFVVLENYYIFPQKGGIYKLNTLHDTLIKVQ